MKAVNGEELLANLRDLFTRYVVLPDCAADVTALWVLYSHCVEAFQVAPYLAILSPEKRCGKTRVLEIMDHVVRNGRLVGNITPAMIYRLNAQAITLLIDEGDTFVVQGDKANEGMRGILNLAHTRKSAVVIRGDGESFTPKEFNAFGAKAIAMIGELPDTVDDRAIKIRMRRKLSSVKVERYRIDRMAHTDALGKQCARWAEQNIETLRDADPKMPKGLHDRAEDNWRPLIAIADACGGMWRDRARHVARVIERVGMGAGRLSDGEQLLEDIHDIIADDTRETVKSSDLLAALLAHDRWSSMNGDGRALTAMHLGNMLRAYDIRSVRFYDDTKARHRGFPRHELIAAWEHYVNE
jgi:putative DNA primase/helicase